jgi:triosephosphate isomerase (TIM)
MIVGNWKMHKTIAEALEFLKKLPSGLCAEDIYLAVPFTALSSVADAAGTKLKVGAQNVSEHKEGAYTGEISIRMLKEAGATFSLVGHSERRTYYHETNQSIAHKLKACLQQGFKPILCIGETASERKAGHTQAVLEKQLSEGIQGLTSEEVLCLAVAYEPVWAIGTGHTATAEMAQETHKLCRELLKKRYTADIAAKIPILYGGSVNPNSIEQIIQQPDIDGALVGGASLEVDSFVKIVTIAREYKS